MYKERWKIDDLPWNRFDATRLDPELLRLVRAAAMAERGADRYERYFRNVFNGDPIFQRAAGYWAEEEIRHGETLGRYAELADPEFNFKRAYARFMAGYGIKTESGTSVRGSRSGELTARCIVEIGASSFYTALGEASEEPLLKVICRNIASDEFHHFGMFHSHLKGYLAHEKIGLWRRLKIALGRIRESEDDELAYAYFAANGSPNAVYDRLSGTAAYEARAFPLYKQEHVRRAAAMLFKTCGINLHGFWHDLASRAAWALLQRKARKAIKQAL